MNAKVGEITVPSSEGDVVLRFFGEGETAADVSVTHPTPGGLCTAWFDGTTHRITREVPLTIEPSLDCPECNWHHSIIEGEIR